MFMDLKTHTYIIEGKERDNNIKLYGNIKNPFVDGNYILPPLSSIECKLILR